MLAEAAQGLVRGDALVAGDAVRGAELEHVQPFHILEEALVMGVPAHRAGREVGPLVAGAELGGTVGTGGESEQVAVVITVVQTHEAGNQLRLGQAVADAVALGVAGLEVLVAQGLIDKVDARQAGGTAAVGLIGITDHGGHVMLLGEHLVIGAVDVHHHVVFLAVGNLAVSVVEITRFRIHVRVVDVLDALAVLVVELAGDGETVEQVPFDAGIGDDAQAFRRVLGQLLEGDGMVVVAGAVQPVGAVLGIDRENRVTVEGTAGVVVALAVHDVRARGQDEVLEQPLVDRETAAELLVVVIDEDTVVPVVVGAGHEVGLVVGAAHLHGGVVGNRLVAQDQVLPAGVGGPGRHEFLDGRIVHAVGVDGAHVLRGEAGVDLGLVLGDGHQHGIVPQVQLGGHLRQRGLLPDAQAGSVPAGLVGGDEDDAVRAAGSVDGRCARVLQDFHGDDVLRVDLGQVAGVAEGEAVHDQERSVGTVHGGVTSHAHDGRRARFLGVVGHLDTGHAALHEGLDGVGRLGGQVFGRQGGDGTGEVALLHAAVTDGDRLLQHDGRFVQDHVDEGLAVHRDGRILVAEAAHREGGVRGHALYGPGAVITADRILVRSGDEHCSAGNRVAVLVHDCAAEPLDGLGMARTRAQQEQRNDCKEKGNNLLLHNC